MTDRSIPRFPRSILGISFGEFSQVLNAIGGIITSTLTVTTQKIVNGLETIKGALTVNGTQTVNGNVNVGGSLVLGSGALDAIPHGAITAYAAPGPIPAAWLLCDGAGYDPVNYPDLFAVIGYTFGGAGAIFNVPDLRGRVAVGPDNGAALITTAPNTLGGFGGEDGHVLTIAEIPSHTHAGNTDVSGAHSHPAFSVTGTTTSGSHQHDSFGIPASNSHNHTGTSDIYPVVTGASGATQYAADVVFVLGGPIPILTQTPTQGLNWSGSATGGIHQHDVDYSGVTNLDGTHVHPVTFNPAGTDTPHNNMMPYLVINYIIKT